MSAIFNQIKESLSMREVAEHFGYSVNRSGFILSPFATENTPSCKLYETSFFDFSTGRGGDLIQFAASILGVNNWNACGYLIDAFNLPFSLIGGIDNKEEIEHREIERLKALEAKKDFDQKRIDKINEFRELEGIYNHAIERKLYPPLSEMQSFVVGELQRVSYNLDILCGLYGCQADIEQILAR